MLLYIVARLIILREKLPILKKNELLSFEDALRPRPLIFVLSTNLFLLFKRHNAVIDSSVSEYQKL
jgi:hypothetical protein